MIDVIPGITEVEYEEIVRRVGVYAPHTQWLHIDVSDGTLVPDQMFHDFSLWNGMPEHLKFEAHVMVVSPEKYIRPLVAAGFARIIAPVEASDPREFLAAVKHEEIEVALSLDGPSEMELIEPFLDELTEVTIMTIEMGASGNPFLPETVEKIKSIHQNYPDLVISVDGGITDATAKVVKEAGATRLVSTHWLWEHQANLTEAISRLKQA